MMRLFHWYASSNSINPEDVERIPAAPLMACSLGLLSSRITVSARGESISSS